ncbi:MAG TPA: glycerophosphodiester phosphodiesterase family protein, partial [bacterium]|nr:glycerophosphodiester phosphodiesterase family protein [bacterium]
PELHSFCTQRWAVLLYLQAYLPSALARWPPHDTLQVPERVGWLPYVTPRLLAAAHGLGVPVIVWTVNDPAAMVRLLRMGVDGIMTDRPDLWSGVLSSLGNLAPRPGAAHVKPPRPPPTPQGVASSERSAD